MGTRGEDGARELATLDTPVVVLGEQLRAVSSAWVDNVAGGALAASHLLSLGHRHIGIVRGNSHLSAPWSVPDDRSTGCVQRYELQQHHQDEAGRRLAGRWQQLFVAQ